MHLKLSALLHCSLCLMIANTIQSSVSSDPSAMSTGSDCDTRVPCTCACSNCRLEPGPSTAHAIGQMRSLCELSVQSGTWLTAGTLQALLRSATQGNKLLVVVNWVAPLAGPSGGYLGWQVR
jgi:hypothetical protein